MLHPLCIHLCTREKCTAKICAVLKRELDHHGPNVPFEEQTINMPLLQPDVDGNSLELNPCRDYSCFQSGVLAVLELALANCASFKFSGSNKKQESNMKHSFNHCYTVVQPLLFLIPSVFVRSTGCIGVIIACIIAQASGLSWSHEAISYGLRLRESQVKFP